MDSKRVNVWPQPFSQTVVFSFLFFQVTPLIEADEDDQLYFTGIIPVVFWCINYTIYINWGLELPRFKLLEDSLGFTCSNDIKIYIETAVVVVVSYVSLLGVNWSYIWLAVFPVISIGFIIALRNELNRKSGKEMKKAEGQEAAVLVLYWVLCFMGQFHISDSFAISQFLLFFSFMLGALTRMMMRLSLTGAAPGFAPASVLLRKATLVVLLVTVHAGAAELLGENVILFILPELAPVLLWFSIHLDCRDGSVITVEKIRAHRNVITVFTAASAVVLAFVAASMDESVVLSWCTKAMVSWSVSGLLVYYIVFMLCQWPARDSTATLFVEEAIKLFKLWANILLIAPVALLVFAFLAAVCLGLHQQMVAELAKILRGYVTRSSSS